MRFQIDVVRDQRTVAVKTSDPSTETDVAVDLHQIIIAVLCDVLDVKDAIGEFVVTEVADPSSIIDQPAFDLVLPQEMLVEDIGVVEAVIARTHILETA